MAGRYRSKAGINYPFITEISNPDDKLHLHIDFDSIINEGYKIIVLNHQPGIGKTHTVMDYIMNKCRKDDNFTFFYFTDKHKTINEHLERLRKEDKKIVETIGHWKGFGKHCLGHPEIENIDKLLGFNISIDTVKEFYKLDDYYKEYKHQFKNTKRVFAPFQYLSNEEFLNNPPKIVFLDERISQIETYAFDKEEIARGLELIKAPPEYIEHARRGNKEDINFFWDEKVREEIEKLYNKTIIRAIQKGRKKQLDKYKKLNPYKLLQYLKWSKIYKYEIDSYSLPFYYKALDVITENDIPIVILDATFNIELFSYFLETYNGEMQKMRQKKFKGFKNLRVKILKSDVSNNKSIIYRMHPKGAWPKVSFTKEKDTTWPWLLEDLHQLRRIFGDANIGIITRKELSWLFESMNFDVEYYGNLRGTNKLEKKLVLVIIGTWLPIPPSWEDDKKSFDKNKDYIDYLAKKYFLTEIKKEKDVMEVRVGAPLDIEGDFPQIYASPDSKARVRMTIESKINTPKGMTNYLATKYADKVDEFPLSMINTIWFDEIYQAFHRNRGLRYPRIIFAYAWFPEPKMTMRCGEGFLAPELLTSYDLRNEFKSTKDVPETRLIEQDSVRKVMRKEEKEEIFNRYRQQYKGGLIQELMKHIELDANVSDIVREFKIHTKGEKRGAYTKPITELKKAYNKVKEIVEYK
jgi:hypothetical protein